MSSTNQTANTRRRNVLLLPLQKASLQELLILAEGVRDDGRYTPVMVMAKPWPLDTAQYPGIEFVYLEKPPAPEVSVNAAPVSLAAQVKRWLKPWLFRAKILPGRLLPTAVKRTLPFALFEWINMSRHLNIGLGQALALFDQYDPAAILLTGDRNLGVEAGLIRVARARGRQRIVISFAHSGRDDVAFSRKQDVIYRMDSRAQGILKRWVQQHYPNQVYQSPYGSVLFFTPVTTILLGRMDMLPSNPWAIGGGYADLVTMIGEEDRDRYIEMGVDPQKLVITGQPSLDLLYRAACNAAALRDRLIAQYGLDGQQPILLCSMPQLAEHQLLDWPTHWKEMHDLVGALAQTGANVLLSLHPKSQPAAYQFLETEYNVKLLQEPLSEVLPAAHVFTATFSSTVRWAVLLGIPTVVFDFYRFNYTIYDQLTGIVKITDKSVFVDALRRVLQDRPYYEQLQQALLKDAQTIALFDGQANRRIIDLIAGSSTRQEAG
ncbi:MAG: hypothetical protein IT324_20965 [Anaerolineae bacterium]|nr:hypothetical protein [Anaerolineae bacterium]